MKSDEEKSASGDTIKTTIRIKRDLWKKILHHAIDADLSQQGILENALTQYLKRAEGRK